MTCAAKKFGIPKTTLHHYLKRGNKLQKYGGQTVLSQEEEEEESLVHGILVAAKWGYPFTKSGIRYVDFDGLTSFLCYKEVNWGI